jgi:hypothetical protein
MHTYNLHGEIDMAFYNMCSFQLQNKLSRPLNSSCCGHSDTGKRQNLAIRGVSNVTVLCEFRIVL